MLVAGINLDNHFTLQHLSCGATREHGTLTHYTNILQTEILFKQKVK